MAKGPPPPTKPKPSSSGQASATPAAAANAAPAAPAPVSAPPPATAPRPQATPAASSAEPAKARITANTAPTPLVSNSVVDRLAAARAGGAAEAPAVPPHVPRMRGLFIPSGTEGKAQHELYGNIEAPPGVQVAPEPEPEPEPAAESESPSAADHNALAQAAQTMTEAVDSRSAAPPAEPQQQQPQQQQPQEAPGDAPLYVNLQPGNMPAAEQAAAGLGGSSNTAGDQAGTGATAAPSQQPSADPSQTTATAHTAATAAAASTTTATSATATAAPSTSAPVATPNSTSSTAQPDPLEEFTTDLQNLASGQAARVRSDSLAVKVAQGVRQQLQQAPAAEAPRVAATEAAPSTSHEEAGSEAAAKRFRRNKTSIRNLFGSSRKPKGPTTPVKVVAPETRAAAPNVIAAVPEAKRLELMQQVRSGKITIQQMEAQLNYLAPAQSKQEAVEQLAPEKLTAILLQVKSGALSQDQAALEISRLIAAQYLPVGSSNAPGPTAAAAGGEQSNAAGGDLYGIQPIPEEPATANQELYVNASDATIGSPAVKPLDPARKSGDLPPVPPTDGGAGQDTLYINTGSATPSVVLQASERVYESTDQALYDSLASGASAPEVLTPDLIAAVPEGKRLELMQLVKQGKMTVQEMDHQLYNLAMSQKTAAATGPATGMPPPLPTSPPPKTGDTSTTTRAPAAPPAAAAPAPASTGPAEIIYDDGVSMAAAQQQAAASIAPPALAARAPVAAHAPVTSGRAPPPALPKPAPAAVAPPPAAYPPEDDIYSDVRPTWAPTASAPAVQAPALQPRNPGTVPVTLNSNDDPVFGVDEAVTDALSLIAAAAAAARQEDSQDVSAFAQALATDTMHLPR